MSTLHDIPGPISFCIRGLPHKEETLFKSFVRLIAHRTHQRWVPTETEGDVWIVPAGTDVPVPAGRVKIHVGDAPPHGEHAIHLPFHADELEKCLNDVGPVAMQHKRKAGTPQRLPAQMRLVRWPGVKFTRTPDQMRMATILISGYISLSQLHARSGVPLQQCEDFLHELEHEGLLSHGTAVDAPERVPQPRLQVDGGLLAQIRNRLRRIAL